MRVLALEAVGPGGHDQAGARATQFPSSRSLVCCARCTTRGTPLSQQVSQSTGNAFRRQGLPHAGATQRAAGEARATACRHVLWTPQRRVAGLLRRSADQILAHGAPAMIRPRTRTRTRRTAGGDEAPREALLHAASGAPSGRALPAPPRWTSRRSPELAESIRSQV